MRRCNNLIQITNRTLAHGVGQGASSQNDFTALQQIAGNKVNRWQIIMADNGIKTGGQAL